MHQTTYKGLALTALLLLVGFKSASGQERLDWTPAPAMPTARSGLAAVELGGWIYTVGGRDQMERPLDVLERYDPLTRSWDILAPMPTPRFDAAAVAYQGQILVIGGRGFEAGLPPGQQKRLVYGIVEVYDPASDSWAELPSLGVGRNGLAAFVLDDTVYVVGGSNEQDLILGDVESFSGSDRTWRGSGRFKLGFPRAALTVVVAGDRPYAIGGFTPVPVNSIRDLEGGIDLPRPQRFRAKGAHAAVATGDSIFIMGGRGPAAPQPADSKGVFDDVDLVVPSTGHWEEVRPMLRERESFAAVVVDGTIYVIGGRDEDGTVLRAVEMLQTRSVVATEDPHLPADFFVRPAAPNPFFEATTLSYSVSSRTDAESELAVYDVLGRRVRTLVRSRPAQGRHTTIWDGRADDGTRVASGLYVYVLTQGPLRTNGKVVFIR